MEFSAPVQQNVLNSTVAALVRLLFGPTDHPELVLPRVITAEDLEQLPQSSRPVLMAEHTIGPGGQHLGQGKEGGSCGRSGPCRR